MPREVLTDEERKSRRRASQEKYRLANREKLRAAGRAYVAANAEKVNATTVKWQQENKERLDAYQREYRAKNAEKERSRAGTWKKRNVESERVRLARWAAENKDKRCIGEQNRRERKRNGGGKLSPDLAQKLLVLQKGKCACCRVSLDGGYHLDHVMPLALGGPHEDANIQLLCPTCNHSKHAKHPVEFMQQKGFLL